MLLPSIQLSEQSRKKKDEQAMDPLIGKVIGENQYEIQELIGTGGMGAVYKAHDMRLGRTVAIKVMRFDRETDTKDRDRFMREAQSLALLEHSNILRIYELLRDGDTYYMVMQYVGGGSLRTRIRQAWSGELEEGITPGFILTIVSQVARALDYAHNRHIIHRDIKPANILLAEEDLTLLADFGVAKWTEVTQSTSLTGEGIGVGTPAYMSPEQINNKDLGPASDIYSLAIVTYEMMTGRPPFEGDTLSVIYQQINTPPPPPTELNEGIPPEVEAVLLKALAKDPVERYAKAGTFVKELQEAFESLTGELVFERGPLGERLQESAFWGTLQLSRRRVEESGAKGFVQRTTSGFLRLILTLIIVILLLAIIVVGAASLVLGSFAQNAVAGANWDFGTYEVTYTEEELGKAASSLSCRVFSAT
jgi:serine/threonine protein kinase